MKANKETIYRMAILILVEIILVYLLYTNDITYFVHPRTIPFIYITMGIIIVLIVAQSYTLPFAKFHYQYSIFSYTIVPFMICGALIINQGSFLQAEKKRVEEQNYMEQFNQKPLEERIYNDKFSIYDNEFYTFEKLLYEKQDILAGKKITYTVFVHYREDLNSNQFIAARMTMICCAADMIPNGLIVNMNHTPKWKEGTWIKLTGTITFEDKIYYQQPMLDFIEAEEVEKPVLDTVYPSY